MKVLDPILPNITVELSEPERWALTKAALIGLKTQDATFGPEDLEGELFDFTQSEFDALQSALSLLNRANNLTPTHHILQS